MFIVLFIIVSKSRKPLILLNKKLINNGNKKSKIYFTFQLQL